MIHITNEQLLVERMIQTFVITVDNGLVNTNKDAINCFSIENFFFKQMKKPYRWIYCGCVVATL